MNETKFFLIIVAFFSIVLSVGFFLEDDGVTCIDFPLSGPRVCHTQAEWDKISEENWKWVECSNSQPEDLTYLEVEERCGGRDVIHEVDFE